MDAACSNNRQIASEECGNVPSVPLHPIAPLQMEHAGVLDLHFNHVVCHACT